MFIFRNKRVLRHGGRVTEWYTTEYARAAEWAAITVPD